MEIKKNEKANLENKRSLFVELGLLIGLAVTLVAFEWTTKPSEEGGLDIQQQEILEEEIIPITRTEVTPPPPPPEAKVFELDIVEDDVDIDEIEFDDMEIDEDSDIEFVPFDEDEEEAEEEVFFIVEDMPSFRGGGQNAFRQYIQENLKYPEIAAENGIQGKVFVQFAVNSKGDVVDVKVVRGVDPALDKEAVRVVKSSPKWAPGRQRGKPVKVQFTFPIFFVLQD